MLHRILAWPSLLLGLSAWINQHLAIAPNLPFGGAKWSGIGVENGPWGLLGFTEIQVVNSVKM